MKIYNKYEFLKLPPGTFFAKGVKWFMDGFCIKQETTGNDFYYINILSIDESSRMDIADRCEEMLEKGVSYPICFDKRRDGTFNSEDVFLVFEKEDLQAIKSLIDLNLQ